MFIKEGVYRSVDVSGLTAPIAEGTILTAAGAIAAADGSDAYGIVPENVYVMPPTKMINVAVGGIIDLLDPANANVTLSEAVMTKLGEDFNFVQFNEHTGGGGSGSVEYEPVLAETTKSLSEHGWTTSFSGGPILEGTSYRVIVNGVTYEPLIGTAGDLSYICLGNTYVDDADPSGDYPFGIFYKNGTLTAWLETGDSITMQIDQIITEIPVPAPRDADIGKVLTVVSEYEAGAEAIPAQTVTVVEGIGTVQNANISQWTEGQRVSVTYRGTTYTGQITDAEGALVFGTADFTLSYDSTTGVLTVEDIEHSGNNTISAQYLTQHANVDWETPSGGDFFVTESDGVLDKTWREIYTALSNGMICKVLYVTEGYNATITLLNSATYDDEFYFVYPNNDRSYWYQTSTADGYPEFQED